MIRPIFLFLVILLASCQQKVEIPQKVETPKPKAKVEEEAPDQHWKQIKNNELFVLDIRYATKNNFVGEEMYDCGKCFLRTPAAEALNDVAKSLKQIGYKIVLFDCYRPKPVQQKLWYKVPDPNYVTPPEKGSMHNRGLAVDLSIVDKQGNLLEMGSDYDYFGIEAHTDYFEHPEQVLKNRKLLQDLMVKYGFKGIRTEWWHFSFVDASYEIADWEWDCES